MSSLSNYPDRRAVVGALAAVPALPSLFGLFGPTPARAQTQMTSAGRGFPFVVYGDARPMMYLPSKEGNPDLNQLFVEMFGLVMPEKLAEEVACGLALFTVYPSLGVVLLGMRRSRDVADPAMEFLAPETWWYGWVASAALGGFVIGLVATFLPECLWGGVLPGV